jgi:hypothetical protein
MRIHHLLAACAVSAAFAATVQASSAQTSARTSAFTLSADERTVISRRVVADQRVTALVGTNPRVYVGAPYFDKAQLLAAGRGGAVRRVSVLLYDRQGNRAARAIATADGALERVEQIPPNEVGIQPEDEVEALALVRQNAQIRRAIPDVDRFRPGRASRTAYVMQLLPVRGSDPKDPCTADRCADVIFRTPTGYLTIGAHVDLTRRTAEIMGEGSR